MKNKINKTTYIFLVMSVLMLQIICISAHAAGVTYDSGSASMISTSLVNQDPDPAIAGDTLDVRIGVANNGGAAANNVVLELVPSYPFELVSGEDAINTIGTVQGYQANSNLQIVKYTIKINNNATAGTYNLKIVQHDQEGASNVTVERLFPIDVKTKTSAEVVQIDKTVLIPGKQTPLKFKITNVGNSPIKDLTFSWSNSNSVILPVGSDNTKYIKYLDAGASADLEYQVIADSGVSAGLYQLALSLAYTDSINSSVKTINTIAGVYVGGGTDFDIAFSESSSGTTSFTIANIGSNPATSVSIIIPVQQSWQVTGANSVIIGNLNTGDYTVASFTLAQSTASIPTTTTGTTSGATSSGRVGFNSTNRQNQNVNPGETSGNMTQSNFASRQNSNNLKMEIAYTDTMGTRNTIEKNVTLNIALRNSTSFAAGTSTGARGSYGRVPQQSFFSKYKWYIIIVVLAAILVVFTSMRAKYKREKLINPKFEVKDLFKKTEHSKKR